MNSLVDLDIKANPVHLDDVYHTQIIEYSVSTVRYLIAITDFFIDHPYQAYRHPVGAHIRHLIDNYDALLKPHASMIDYDRRERNPELEKDPVLARTRLFEIIGLLNQLDLQTLNQSLWVTALGGEKGTFQMKALSSLGRELIFFNSHTVHHLAIIKPHCQSLGVPIGESFGIAPSTIAHHIHQTQK
jgi:hypothetical protein